LDEINIPSRHELESVLSAISAINSKIKKLDREVGLSKAYVSKSDSKPAHGRLSPVDGESDVRWKLRDAEQGKRGKSASTTGRPGSPVGGVQKLPIAPLNDKMED